MKTNLMSYLSSIYFVGQRPHVSGLFVAHHREVLCFLADCLLSITTRQNSQSTKKHNTNQLLYI